MTLRIEPVDELVEIFYRRDLILRIVLCGMGVLPVHPDCFDPEFDCRLNIMVLAASHVNPASISDDSSSLLEMSECWFVGSDVLRCDLDLEGACQVFDSSR